MKKTVFWPLLVMVLVFGMAAVGNLDAQTDNSLNGTWVSIEDGVEIEFTFNNGNYEQSKVFNRGNHLFEKGTYSTRNGLLTISVTHLMMVSSMPTNNGYESGKWYTTDEYKTVATNNLRVQGFSQQEINELIEFDISTKFWKYSVVSSSLIITVTLDGRTETIIFTKK